MEWNFEEWKDRLMVKTEGAIKFFTFRPEEFSNGGTALKKINRYPGSKYSRPSGGTIP